MKKSIIGVMIIGVFSFAFASPSKGISYVEKDVNFGPIGTKETKVIYEYQGTSTILNDKTKRKHFQPTTTTPVTMEAVFECVQKTDTYAICSMYGRVKDVSTVTTVPTI